MYKAFVTYLVMTLGSRCVALYYTTLSGLLHAQHKPEMSLWRQCGALQQDTYDFQFIPNCNQLYKLHSVGATEHSVTLHRRPRLLHVVACGQSQT